MRFILWLLIMGLTGAAAGQDTSYPVNAIPDSLKQGAGAVVRLANITYTIDNLHKVTFACEKTVSILNKASNNLAVITLYYDDDINIKNFRATLFDADGREIKSYGEKDGEDLPDIENALTNMANSTRKRRWDLRQDKVPYTVQYSYQLVCRNTDQMNFWNSYEGGNVSVEEETFKVVCNKGIDINFTEELVHNTSAVPGTYLWTVKNQCSFSKGDSTQMVEKGLPLVGVMMKKFSYHNIPASADSWNDLGAFNYSLIKGRDELGETGDRVLDSIFNSGMGKVDKIKALYKYLQANFRFVEITHGIGGWQPAEAEVTFKRKYGDCKGLVMLMKALLKKAGIESYYSIVESGWRPREQKEDFPNLAFNHSILCVPVNTDTIWLECTNNSMPFNYLGYFTGSRRALLVYDNGGRLINTPVYNETVNTCCINATISANNDVNEVKASVAERGILQDWLNAVVNMKDKKMIEAQVYSNMYIHNSFLDYCNFRPLNRDSAVISFDVSFSNENIIRNTGQRIFIKTNIMTPLYQDVETSGNLVLP
ncbi:MAG TPA: DUF3857 domain-containing protein, partial [Chitinophagales bacterium]|nr:DUF3857 domain-containing protein [Chitinophagales bacterium]